MGKQFDLTFMAAGFSRRGERVRMFDTAVAICTDVLARTAAGAAFSGPFERTVDADVSARDRPGARGEQVGEDGACASESSR